MHSGSLLIFWQRRLAGLHVAAKPQDVQSGEPGSLSHALVPRGAVVVLPSARKFGEPGNWFAMKAQP